LPYLQGEGVRVRVFVLLAPKRWGDLSTIEISQKKRSLMGGLIGLNSLTYFVLGGTSFLEDSNKVKGPAKLQIWEEGRGKLVGLGCFPGVEDAGRKQEEGEEGWG